MLLGACGGDGDGTGGTMQTAGAGSASTAGTTPAGGETPATDATITQDSTTAATDTTNAETTTAVVGTSTTTTTETAETPTDTAGTETAPDVEVDYAAIAASGACITDGGVDEDGFIPLYAHPDNNYTFSSTVSVSTIAAMPNTELFFDWSTLTTDFLGHDVDPLADIDTVALILWELTLEEMTEKLNADELSAQYAAAAIALYTNNEVTTGSIFDFQVAGGGELPPEELMPRLDPANYDPATHTYALMAQTGGVLGQGVKMVQAFHLDEASENTQVDITPESTSLSFDVDLSDSLVPVSLPLGETNVLVDWSDMETTALNLEWKIRSIQEVMVAKYSLTPADLEAQFLDLELIADEMYRGEVEAGDEFVLTDLVEETTGAPFNGITEDGTWVLALVCTRCSNPAPWYLTRLQPCAQ
jgi:hypothetical protein